MKGQGEICWFFNQKGFAFLHQKSFYTISKHQTPVTI